MSMRTQPPTRLAARQDQGQGVNARDFDTARAFLLAETEATTAMLEFWAGLADIPVGLIRRRT